MGKSPGKWIKSLLLGKKSSKSNLSNGKGKLYATKKEERLISSKLTESGLPVEPQSISAPILTTVTRNGVNLEREVSPNLLNDGLNDISIEHDGAHNASSILSPQEDSESLRLEQAATKTQAVFRGFLARRAFRTLKGIIRLQALIRGHLVRRQAVATLYSAWGIIKFQALVRGQKVRRTDIAIEVQKIHSRSIPDANISRELSASPKVKNLSNNAFVRKLLDSSATMLPLLLQYEAGEPNSALEWLERWMKSRFWEPPQPIKRVSSKSRVKNERNQNEQSKTKRTVRKLANGKVENGSSRAASGSEHAKPKRNPRKVPSNPGDKVQDQSQNGYEKVKRNLKKIPDSSKEVTDDGAEVKNETPNQTLNISPASAVADVTEEDSAEKSNVDTLASAEPSNLEAKLELKTLEYNGNDPVEESNAFSIVHSPSTENGNYENTPRIDKELSSKDGVISSESLNTSQRRDSLTGKMDNPENVLPSLPKVPSYMAPTQSAKAKLRAQGSPRLSREVVEKNGVIRRHSLPSSTNSNLSTQSPRAQKLVQSAGKGPLREKSLSSSRDASDKAMKAEWKR